MHIEYYFFLIAFLMIAFGTGLSPILAYVLYKLFARKEKWNEQQPSTSFTLDILIPAHNEPLSLPASIAAMKSVRSKAPSAIEKIRIVAGLSNWSGPDAEKAARDADLVLKISEPGKWQAIRALVLQSKADWVALADAGVIWEDTLLQSLTPALSDANSLAVNPRFQELKPGLMQKCIWTFESFLKKIENRCGGPISLHGATIFYRRKNLQHALETLQGSDWLNDDVVLPLTMRRLYPHMKIIYKLDASVTDRFPSWNASELQRRKRLLFGNIQWVQKFYFAMWIRQPMLAALATRRVARMVWAWWFCFLGLGFLFFFRTLGGDLLFAALLMLTFSVIIALLRSSSGRRLLEAFWISVVFPFYFATFWVTGKLPNWK